MRGRLGILRLCQLLIGAVVIPMRWDGSAVLCQTTWFRYAGNPVLEVGAPGSWDGNLAIPTRVLHQGSVYRMWYSGFSGTRYWHLGLATSLDGVHWKKFKGNPVLKAGPDAWDSSSSCHGYVTFDDSGYRMWYTGGSVHHTFQIGYATSHDGIQWIKARQWNPILNVGRPGSWDSRGLSRPSVLGPDSLGNYSMWFCGEDNTVIYSIGYAVGRGPTSWRMSADPVLGPGRPGSWDEHGLFYPRVLYHDGVYEMWYGGMTWKGFSTRKVGYARSSDGIHWTEWPKNPVLDAGPPGSWDQYAVLVGDINFDGSFYHLWYHGINENEEVGVGQIGYAISPAGARIDIGPQYVRPGEPVSIRTSVSETEDVAVSAEIRTPEGESACRLDLFDDGRHGDDLSSDGCFANSWIPLNEQYYVVDLFLHHQSKKFLLRNAGIFSTAGPVRCERLEYVGDQTPNPGDSLLVRLVLRNHGHAAPARAVVASLTSATALVTTSNVTFTGIGTIPPHSSAVTPGYCSLYISPDCPPGTDVTLNLTLASSGTVYWRDAVVLHIVPPWWRTPWAFVSYAVVLVGSVVTAVRFVGVRKLKRRIRQLEREQTLERERTRISQDMHDEVGARLTEIGILGELARKDIRDPEKTDAEIRKITETSREVIASISEIIWAMNARNDALGDLVAFVREYASKYLGTAGIACGFEIPDEIPELNLSAEARRNIFLVVKEALHNIAKHSGASQVNVKMEFPAKWLQITIEDNGRGFDTASPTRFGNGLRNMAKRMSDIGGTIRISSNPGPGTNVEIEAKCSDH